MVKNSLFLSLFHEHDRGRGFLAGRRRGHAASYHRPVLLALHRLDLKLPRLCAADGVLRQTVFLGPRPVDGFAEAEGGHVVVSAVPHDAICRGGRSGNGAVEHECPIVLCARRHHLVELVKLGKLSKVVLEELLAVGKNVLAHREQVIDVGAQRRIHLHHVLRGAHERDVIVSSVEEDGAHCVGLQHTLLIQAIVQQNENGSLFTAIDQFAL